MNTFSKRLQAIDLVRSIVMLLMIFVNDVAGVHNLPAWIGHTEAHEDGMGFADTIFPAFLFIVGLSLPFAIQNRLSRGHSFLAIAFHILLRSAALIIMGFYHVNMESYNAATSLLPEPVWSLIVTLAFFLTWLDYPATLPKARRYLLSGTGIVLLIVMAVLYKGNNPGALTGMKPHWWGILGLIGWAYLVCALVYLVGKGNFYVLSGVSLLFAAINIGAHTGSLPFNIPVLGDASSATLIMAGTITGMVYRQCSAENTYRRLWITLSAYALLLLAAGFVIRPYAGGISKIMATPAWVFICAAITMLFFEICVWLADRQGKAHIFRLIKPAGTSTLTCYLLPYILYNVYSLCSFSYPSLLNEGMGGIARSMAVALLVVIATGWLEKIRIRLKV